MQQSQTNLGHQEEETLEHRLTKTQTYKQE